MKSLFLEDYENEAIERIRKFARIADAMELDIAVGFSGGKDSQVTLHLCERAGIKFTAYFNHSFESVTTLKFIREHYPQVIRRRDVKEGFIRNIVVNHSGMLPTVFSAYCCDDYKHQNSKTDACKILGIRKAESAKRAIRRTFEYKNITTQKKYKAIASEYFKDECQGVGSHGTIALHPIVDWSEKDVWDYIHKWNLSINPEYEESNRVGCIVCPKANFTSNHKALIKYPKLIDAFISDLNNSNYDWVITGDNQDYEHDKVYYICRWLNHSFMPFSKKQEELYRIVRENYDNYHKFKNKEL